MKQIEHIEELLDAKEVRAIIRCSLPLIYKMAERGQLPCVRIPCPGNGEAREKHLVRFKRNDVFNFIEKYYRAPDY